MTDDQLLLANAYVDDDLTADERARAEADDEVMAEVARLRTTVAALRDVEPPDAARRDAALAAALRSAERPTPVAPPIPLRPRRAWWAGAGIAAALVAIVIGGAVVLRATSGDDDDDSTSLEVRSAAQPSAEDQSSTGGAATTVPTATTAGALATPEQSAGEQADGATTAAGGLVPTTTVPAHAAAPEATASAAVEVLFSPADLAAFASLRPVPPSAPRCTGGQYVGSATYAGVTPPVAVEVFVDGRDAVARDATTCREVARAPAR